MNIDDYQRETRKTAGKHKNIHEEIVNWSLGLGGETGEVQDIIKKVVFHGHELDVERIGEELGDSLYYHARLADSLGLSLGKILKDNLEKLNKRYPDGFSSERSINRKDN